MLPQVWHGTLRRIGEYRSSPERQTKIAKQRKKNYFTRQLIQMLHQFGLSWPK